MYEIFPVAGGAILGFLVVKQGGLRAPRLVRLAGLVLAVAIGVAVAFVSGEWRHGVIYPIWDACQATFAYTLVTALGLRVVGRLSRHEEG